MKFISVKPLTIERPMAPSRTTSNSSTHSVLDHKRRNFVQTNGARRRVSFNEDDNKYYANKQVTRDECRETWYSGLQMKEFKAEVCQLARRIIQSEKQNEDPKSWTLSLVETYALFCQAESLAEIEHIMENDLIAIPTELIGMEKWVLRPVVQDRLARRRDLQEKVHEIQGKHSSARVNCKAIRKASRKISAPGRLYAHHVAHMAWQI
jgi:hypothetical protein